KIAVFIIATVVTFVLLAAIIYFNELRNGNTLTHTESTSMLVVCIIAIILIFFLWVWALIMLFRSDTCIIAQPRPTLRNVPTVTAKAFRPPAVVPSVVTGTPPSGAKTILASPKNETSTVLGTPPAPVPIVTAPHQGGIPQTVGGYQQFGGVVTGPSGTPQPTINKYGPIYNL